MLSFTSRFIYGVLCLSPFCVLQSELCQIQLGDFILFFNNLSFNQYPPTR
jgi:hypothetical protein